MLFLIQKNAVSVVLQKIKLGSSAATAPHKGIFLEIIQTSAFFAGQAIKQANNAVSALRKSILPLINYCAAQSRGGFFRRAIFLL